jgi:hypothetical protein
LAVKQGLTLNEEGEDDGESETAVDYEKAGAHINREC